MREKLMKHACRILKREEEAEDIVQEVFLKLWAIRSDLDKYNSVEALSVTVTKNLCFNKLKNRRDATHIIEDIVFVCDSNTPYSQLVEKDSVEQVMRIIDQLPNLQQSILKMKHIEGLEVEEIAELTGSNAEAIRTNLSRGRKRVKELFFKIQNV